MAQTSHTQRIYNLDAIRGLAVLGILFLNIYYFGSPTYGYTELASPSINDIWLGHFSALFLEGRFISLFSILFGVGLLIQQQNFDQRRLDGLSQSKRRLKWLMLFGALHGIFIWIGDVLFAYAICGLFTLNYYRLAPNAQLKKAVTFLVIGSVLMCAMMMLAEEEPISRHSELFAEDLSIWTDSYGKQLLMQLFYFSVAIIAIPFSVMFYLSGMMLLGMALYQLEVFSKGLTKITSYKLLAGSLVCFSINLSLKNTDFSYYEAVSSTLTLIGGLFMGLVYLSLIVKLCRNRAKVLAPLQRVGRLAFSLYILQSILGVIVFRYLYPEWMMSFERSDYLLLALAYSLIQIALASLYFKFFDQGPLEKLWRHLTYRKLIALPQAETAPSSG